MHRTLLKLFLKSCSDNLKNPKSVGIVAVAVMFAMCGAVAEAQQSKKVYRAGYLSPRLGIESREEAFRQSMRDLGYIEGQNLVIEWRFAKGKNALFPSLRPSWSA